MKTDTAPASVLRSEGETGSKKQFSHCGECCPRISRTKGHRDVRPRPPTRSTHPRSPKLRPRKVGALAKLSPSRANAAHFPVDPRPTAQGRSPRKPTLCASLQGQKWGAGGGAAPVTLQ